MHRRTFGEAVATLRRERGLTQKELASRIRRDESKAISPQYLNDIEHDRRRPLSENFIAAVADALEADPAYLTYMAGQFPLELRELQLDEEQLRIAIQAFRRATLDG